MSPAWYPAVPERLTAHPSLAERQALTAARVTLNGEPARVTGHTREFAQVTQVKTGLGCQWAWSTVAHIIANREGKFES